MRAPSPVAGDATCRSDIHAFLDHEPLVGVGLRRSRAQTEGQTFETLFARSRLVEEVGDSRLDSGPPVF